MPVQNRFIEVMKEANMPAVQITGMGYYLPRNKVLSTELDFQLNLPQGSVQKNPD